MRSLTTNQIRSINSARHSALEQRAFSMLQDEARIANELQRQDPQLGRTNALRLAKDIVSEKFT